LSTDARRLSDERLLADYRLMVRIRMHEQSVKRLFQEGRIGGTTHMCIGQEAVATGVVGQLRADDYIASTHRGHGHMLAKGGGLKPMLAEILGKATGYCRGKGGSMHIASLEVGNLGACGIVSGGIPLAVGAALSIQMRGTDQVAVAAFGDGASSEGNTHESMNLAALWGLPVLFLCENNQYAVSTHCSRAVAGGSVAARAAGYGLPGRTVDGNDLEAVHFAAAEALDHVRSGNGPYVLECKTYRIEGHYVGDATIYREDDEVADWVARDPIRIVERLLIERAIVSEDELTALTAEVEGEVNEAVRYALESPEPALESIYEDVYTDVL
jgi:pyruvate dehydrogenase E1 component alpha subunit